MGDKKISIREEQRDEAISIAEFSYDVNFGLKYSYVGKTVFKFFRKDLVSWLVNDHQPHKTDF